MGSLPLETKPLKLPGMCLGWREDVESLANGAGMTAMRTFCRRCHRGPICSLNGP